MFRTLQVTKKEWTWVAIVSAGIMLITLIPYLYGFLISPSNKTFTTVNSINMGDTQSYFAWIEQARQGNVLFRDLYTSEPQTPALFHPLFLILGRLGSITHVSNIVVYQCARFIFGILFFFLSYLFISYFFSKPKDRIFTLIILATASGFGWFIGFPSTDIWMPETITFFNVYMSPLNTISLCLMLSAFIIALKIIPTKKIYNIIILACILNLLVLIHSYDFIIVTMVLGLYFFYQTLVKKTLSPLEEFLYAILFSMPSIFWQTYVLWKNQPLGIWANIQTNVPAYSPIHFVLGYGLSVLFAILGISIIFWRKQFNKFIFVFFWLGSIIFLMYNPLLYRLQRKFTEGLHIPIIILCSIGIIWWINFLTTKLWIKYFVCSILVLYLSFSNIFIMKRDIGYFKNLNWPFYLKNSEILSISWLQSMSNSNGVILSGYNLGNVIPGQIARTVFLGQGDQTVDFKEKYQIVRGMLSSKSNFRDPLPEFLKSNNIGYVVVDDEVRSWGGLDVTDRPYLKLAYENQDVQIYQVK